MLATRGADAEQRAWPDTSPDEDDYIVRHVQGYRIWDLKSHLKKQHQEENDKNIASGKDWHNDWRKQSDLIDKKASGAS